MLTLTSLSKSEAVHACQRVGMVGPELGLARIPHLHLELLGLLHIPRVAHTSSAQRPSSQHAITSAVSSYADTQVQLSLLHLCPLPLQLVNQLPCIWIVSSRLRLS